MAEADAAGATGAETLQRVAVQVQVVAAGEPDDELAGFTVEPEAQGAAAERDVLDVFGEAGVVAVAFAAAFAATLELLPGLEVQVKMAAAARYAFDLARSDEAVQLLESAQSLRVAHHPGQAVLAALRGGGFRSRSLFVSHSPILARPRCEKGTGRESQGRAVPVPARSYPLIACGQGTLVSVR